MSGSNNLFEGLTVNWGFTPSDIFSNGMALVLSLAAFVLLGLAIMYVPALIKLIRDAVKPS